MAANANLTWEEITDMTPGLWDQQAAYNKFAAPPNAFVTLNDYQPLKAGGLRPFYAATALASMPPVIANERPAGIFVRNGVIRTGAGGTGNPSVDIVIVTEDNTDKKFTIYRYDGTVGAPAWSTRKLSAAATDDSHQPVLFALFKDTNNVEWLLMSITQNGGDDGLWAMRYDYTVASNTGNDGLVSSLFVAASGPVVISQQKIFLGHGNKIEYSNTGLTTFTGAPNNFGTQTITPNRSESNIKGMSVVEPSDVLIAKEGAPWVTISGDITVATTPIREMGDEHHVRYAKQMLVKSPGGVCFVEPGGRIFETDGRNFRSLTDQISARTITWTGNMTGAGTPAFGNGYLFFPGHDADTVGYVFDFNTNSIFSCTAINPVFSYYDAYSGTMYCVNHTPTTPSGVSIPLLDGSSRVTTGVIQTVPYADKNGRNIDIREVHLFVLTQAAFPGTEFKVELIDENGVSQVTRYKVIDSSRKDVVRLQFPATKSNYLSVKITPKSLDGVSECATIERIRIGFGQNNQIR